MSRSSTISQEFQTQLDESPINLLLETPAVKGSKKKEIKTKATEQNKEIAEIPSKIERPLGKDRMTVQISQDTIERVKNIVYWERLTVAQFVEDALEAAIKKQEKQKGEPYPKRKAQLKPGRPLS